MKPSHDAWSTPNRQRAIFRVAIHLPATHCRIAKALATMMVGVRVVGFSIRRFRIDGQARVIVSPVWRSMMT